jgi:hypothetical protein
MCRVLWQIVFGDDQRLAPGNWRRVRFLVRIDAHRFTRNFWITDGNGRPEMRRQGRNRAFAVKFFQSTSRTWHERCERRCYSITFRCTALDLLPQESGRVGDDLPGGTVASGRRSRI